jgi:hypothetical protein
MANVKSVLLLPITYNDGSQVEQSVLDSIFEEIWLLAGGYTIVGEVTGAYRMGSGSKQVDRSLQVWVVIDDLVEGELRTRVARFGAILGQELMYLERTWSDIDFIPPSEREGDVP